MTKAAHEYLANVLINTPTHCKSHDDEPNFSSDKKKNSCTKMAYGIHCETHDYFQVDKKNSVNVQVLLVNNYNLNLFHIMYIMHAVLHK